MDAIRFTTRCDVARLQDDLAAAVRTGEWIARPERGKYHQWSAIALHARHGSTASDVDYHVDADQPDVCAPTPILAHCPYVRELLDSFHSPRCACASCSWPPAAGSAGTAIASTAGACRSSACTSP
jgi:hypothetical protein